MVDDEGFRIFERLLGESPQAFAAFCIYRDAGPKRSLRHVAEVRAAQRGGERKSYTGAPVPGVLRRWSVRYNWPERAAAYDEHMDRVRRQEREEDVRATERAHAQLADAIVEKVKRCLDVFQPATVTVEDVVEPDGTKARLRVVKAQVTAQGIAALARAGVEIKRLSLGLATDRAYDVRELLQQVDRELERLTPKFAPRRPAGAGDTGDPAAATDSESD